MNDRDEEVAWLITRSGSEPVVENLKGWGKSRDVGDRERMERRKRVLRKEENLGGKEGGICYLRC